MSPIALLLLLVIAAVSGSLGLPPVLEVDLDSRSSPVVWSILGSALLVAVLGLITRSRRVA